MNNNNYSNNLTGALFLNDKAGNEKRPDWRGSVEVDGVHFWISGWEKQSMKGAPLISLKLEPKEQSQGPARQPMARHMDNQARDSQQRHQAPQQRQYPPQDRSPQQRGQTWQNAPQQRPQQGGFRQEEPGDLPDF